MSRDTSNVGQRVLGARRTVRGNKDALENIVGGPLPDGAQCYVVEEQAVYRYVATSELPPDGKLIVTPVGGQGRFIRESGLVGLALLEEGSAACVEREGDDGAWLFSGYKESRLAQFEERNGVVRYIGAPPRLALIYGSALLKVNGQASLYVSIRNQMRVVASGSVAQSGAVSASGTAELMPGDAVALCGRGALEGGTGSLRIVLA